MSPELGTLEHLEARTLWTHEAHDFRPLLAENLSLLAEALERTQDREMEAAG